MIRHQEMHYHCVICIQICCLDWKLHLRNIRIIFKNLLTKNISCMVTFFIFDVRDPMQANEALWVRCQNWHFKLYILSNISRNILTPKWFLYHIPIKVIDNLISNCLIISKINHQDMGRQVIDLYANLLKISRKCGSKHNFLSLLD